MSFDLLTRPPRRKQRTENATVCGATAGKSTSAWKPRTWRTTNLRTLFQTMTVLNSFRSWIFWSFVSWIFGSFGSWIFVSFGSWTTLDSSQVEEGEDMVPLAIFVILIGEGSVCWLSRFRVQTDWTRARDVGPLKRERVAWLEVALSQCCWH